MQQETHTLFPKNTHSNPQCRYIKSKAVKSHDYLDHKGILKSHETFLILKGDHRNDNYKTRLMKRIQTVL